MATHDYVISNASGAAVRADLNNALAAIVSNNSNATEPSTTYAYQWWADTGSSPAVMKLRNAANDDWIELFQLSGEWSSTIALEDGTAAAPSLYFKDSGTDTGIFSSGTDEVAISTGGTERMTIDDGGDFVVPVLLGASNTIQVGQRITGSVQDNNGTRSAGIGIIRTAGTGGGTTSGAGIGFYTSSNTFSGYTQQYSYSLSWYILGDGDLIPGTDNYNSVGKAGARCSVIYAGTGTINTSDANLKQDIKSLEQSELNVAIAIKGLIKKFRFIDAIADKGDDARIHVGVIAQEVEQAFIAESLDPRRYGLFCEDTLEDGTKRLSIRYDELLAFVLAAL